MAAVRRRTAVVDEVPPERALYRGAIFLVALVALMLLGVELRWVLIQVFAAAIVAAGMSQVVRTLTDPEGGAAPRRCWWSD
jgi:hypothetical protein